MNLVLAFGNESKEIAAAVFDLSAWESLRLISAADGKAKLLMATRIIVDGDNNADMKELVGVFDDADQAYAGMYEIGLALTAGAHVAWLDKAHLPSDEVMKRIGESTPAASGPDGFPAPKQLILRAARGDCTDGELADLVGRRIAEVKSFAGRDPLDPIAIITEGPR